MSSFTIRKAERWKAKLRIGLSWPSGSGKTYSALLLARGIASDWSKIALIDTENGSGDLYSDLGDYAVLTLEAPFSPERYIEAIHTCEEAGFEVIIIDSVTHEWDGKGGCLESNELLAQTKFKGNTWSAWSKTTPRHQSFIYAIINSSCHTITTARSKTDTIQTEDKKVKKVGLKDIQREGFEYELTLMLNIDRDTHAATASKDRTGLFIDADPFVISEETGQTLAEWNESGVDYELERIRINDELERDIRASDTNDELKTCFERLKSKTADIGKERADALRELILTRKAEIEQTTTPPEPATEPNQPDASDDPSPSGETPPTPHPDTWNPS